MYVLGLHWVGRNASGSAVATTFNDPLAQTLVFPDSFHDAGDAGFSIDITDASTAVTWENQTIIGRGTGHRLEFDGRTTGNNGDVANSPSSQIRDTAIIDNFRPGDAVRFFDNGHDSIGPSNNTVYYVGKTASPSGITLHTTKADAMNISGGLGSSPVALTGEALADRSGYRLEKEIDTRPVLTIVGDASPGSFDIIGCASIRQSVRSPPAVVIGTPA